MKKYVAILGLIGGLWLSSCMGDNDDMDGMEGSQENSSTTGSYSDSTSGSTTSGWYQNDRSIMNQEGDRWYDGETQNAKDKNSKSSDQTKFDKNLIEKHHEK